MSWRAEAVAVWAFVVRNFIMGSRNVFFFFELLFWPMVGVVSIGLMARFLALETQETAFVLIGTMALSVVQVCELEVAYVVLFDVWSKSVKHQFLAPIGVRHLTAGAWVVGIVRGLGIFAILAVLGWWSFAFNPLAPGPLPLAVFLLGCLLTAWIVGIGVCALITMFGTRAEAFAWATVNFVLVLAGIYYPVSVLPPPIAAAAAAMPLTYFLDAYRAHFGFASQFQAPVLTGFALALLYVVLVHLVFLAAVGRARRTGLLLKMSE
ncbi:MAG: ABC transporter permease [Candidatus Rokuibacteriota bacterium]